MQTLLWAETKIESRIDAYILVLLMLINPKRRSPDFPRKILPVPTNTNIDLTSNDVTYLKCAPVNFFCIFFFYK